MINEETYKRVYYWKKILHGIALLITAMSTSLPTKHPKRREKAMLNIKKLSTNISLSLMRLLMKV